MSKLYVPDGAWLVCSKGMKKQQLKVTSQSQVTIAGGKLKATIDDGPGGNFVCGAMATAGAIIGAVLGVAFVIGTIVTGGALALGAGIAMVAAAAGGAALGGLASLIPSICGMLLTDWTPYDQNVLTCGVPPLLENSEIPCRLGGRVIILYSEKAADEMTDVIIGGTAIGVLGTVAFAYIMAPAMSSLGATGAIGYATFKTFGWIALGNYTSGVIGSAGIAYGLNVGLNKGKDWGYSQIPLGSDKTYGDYVDGFQTDVAKLKEIGLQPKDEEKKIEGFEYANDVGGAIDIGSTTIGDRNSLYTTNESSTSVRLDDIEEHSSTRTLQSGKIDGAIEGKSPIVTRSSVITKQDFGGRYQEVNRQYTIVNSQYKLLVGSKTKSLVKSSAVSYGINQWGMFKVDKNGVNGGGFLFGLLQDGAKVIKSFLLEGQAKDVIEALFNEEFNVRVKMTVISGKD